MVCQSFPTSAPVQQELVLILDAPRRRSGWRQRQNTLTLLVVCACLVTPLCPSKQVWQRSCCPPGGEHLWRLTCLRFAVVLRPCDRHPFGDHFCCATNHPAPLQYPPRCFGFGFGFVLISILISITIPVSILISIPISIPVSISISMFQRR